jgi:hypothetical protein
VRAAEIDEDLALRVGLEPSATTSIPSASAICTVASTILKVDRSFVVGIEESADAVGVVPEHPLGGRRDVRARRRSLSTARHHGARGARRLDTDERPG